MRSHAAIAATVAEVVDAGAIPIVLGADHSIAEPDIRACAAAHGPVGLVHFDAHTDTAAECFGVSLSHGTPMYNLVQSGHVDPARYIQVGLRGYWPGEEVFAWQRARGITSLFMHHVAERGIRRVVAEAIAVAGPGPPTAIGAADITALVGSRIVHDLLTGIALRRVAADAGASGHAAARYPVQVG